MIYSGSTPGVGEMFIDRWLFHSGLNKPSQPAAWKEEVGRGENFFPLDFRGGGWWRRTGGGVSEVLDPWTWSAVLNILSTVCLPRADLPDMLSSWLAGDATSLCISPATREASLHFLWINSHTVGEEERPGHRGTGAVMRRKHTHILSLKNKTDNLGYSMNSLGQTQMNPLKASSELKRPKTSVLITASLPVRLSPPRRSRTGWLCN